MEFAKIFQNLGRWKKPERLKGIKEPLRCGQGFTMINLWISSSFLKFEKLVVIGLK